MDKFMTMGQPHVQSTPSTRGYTPDGDDELPSSDDEFTTFNLTKRRLPISRGTTTSFGKSSSAVLIHAAVEMKKEFHNPDGSSVGSVCGEARSNEHFPPNRRPKFWRSEPVNPSLRSTSPHRSLMPSGIVGGPQKRCPRTTLQIPGSRLASEPSG